MERRLDRRPHAPHNDGVMGAVNNRSSSHEHYTDWSVSAGEHAVRPHTILILMRTRMGAMT